MDRDQFLKAASFRREVFVGPDGVSLEIRELSLQERRTVLEASKEEVPAEAIAALTVAMSCPEFTEDDVERLATEVRPEILIACAQRVYEISNMVENSRAEVKKQSGPVPNGSSRTRWRWPWGKLSRNSKKG